MNAKSYAPGIADSDEIPCSFVVKGGLMSTESSSTTTAAPAASSASTQEAPVSQEEILKIFREMLSQREMVIQKISEMEAELSEYT